MNELALNDVSVTARILGAAFYYSPDQVPEIIELLVSGEWVADWHYGSEAQKQGIAAEMAAMQRDDETLDEAYQRLFIGPYALPSPPWGSVWLDKENVLFGESTLQLREWMQANQIDIHLTQNEPEDHFGLLMMMVAWVAEHQPENLSELLGKHILPWGLLYLDKMQEKGDSPFYVGLSKLAHLTLVAWQDSMNIEVDKKLIFYR